MKKGFPERIAIFHNYMDNIGGAEIVTLILARELNADIYKTNFDVEKIRKMGFDVENIFSIGRIPINAPFRQESAYWKFRKLKLGRKYDFYLIAGDWAMSGAVNNKPNLWYVHSPTREIWDLYDYVRRELVNSRDKFIFDLWVFFRRRLNRFDSRKVNKYVSNSLNVKKRVKKYLKKNSGIVHPPIETEKYKCKESKGYWLAVNRLLDHKRVDLQVKAFSKMPDEKLIIVGSYENSEHFQGYARYIKKIKPENVEIKSWIDFKELVELYAGCKGFITTALDEDFGMTPLEAMASGKPVIASNEGGYKETVLDGKTGILIDEIDSEKIIEAVRKINLELEDNAEKYRGECIKQAKKFDIKIFIKRIKEEIGLAFRKG